MINPAVDELAEQVGVKHACALLGRPRGSHYRAKKPPVHGPAPRRPTPPNALTPAEQAEVLAVLTSERFCDKSVSQAWATLLDEGTYLCSMSTMHRILRRNDAAGERRRQAVHPAKKKPELLATKPGQIWWWDITKLRGPGRGIWFQLYVVLDIFSRYVVAWTVQACEDSEIAKTMLEEAFGLHGIPDAVHADSKTVACLGAPGFRDSHADRPWGLPWCRRCSRSILTRTPIDPGKVSFPGHVGCSGAPLARPAVSPEPCD